MNSKGGGSVVGLFIANLAMGVVIDALADVDTLTATGIGNASVCLVSSEAAPALAAAVAVASADSPFFPSSNSL